MFEIFKIKKQNKKAALELSINAIVIVVLAMTLLGLGLGFIRGMFNKLNPLTDDTFIKIGEQLNTDLSTSDSPLVFSKTRLVLDRGASSLEGFGVKNDGNSQISYGIKIGTFNCPDGSRLTPGDVTSPCPDISSWFEYFVGNGEYTVKPADQQVNKVQIDIPRGSTTGLYLLKIVAYTGVWDGSATVVPCSVIGTTCQIFGQTELFLTVA